MQHARSPVECPGSGCAEQHKGSLLFIERGQVLERVAPSLLHTRCNVCHAYKVGMAEGRIGCPGFPPVQELDCQASLFSFQNLMMACQLMPGCEHFDRFRVADSPQRGQT